MTEYSVCLWEKVSVLLCFAICITSLFACGEGVDTSPASSETGSVAFGIEWQGAPEASQGYHKAALDCAVAGVSTVEAEVYDENDTHIADADGGPWDCSAHKGTITDIPPGSNIKIVILAMNSSRDVKYRGESTRITITAGNRTNVGAITVEPAPTARVITPSDGTIFDLDETIAFEGSASNTDGAIVSYEWNFGDGSTSTEQNSSHAYNSAGAYTVTLAVTDDDGATGTHSITVNVDNIPPTATIISPSDGATFDLHQIINLDGSASDTDGVIVSYEWEFGDGSTSTEQNPSHAYNSAGAYTITLTVTDDDGATGTHSITVNVDNIPPTATIISPSDGGVYDEGETITFTGSGDDHEDGTLSGNSLVWTSSTGGQIGTGTSFTHDLSVGSYTITLTATDSDGATGSDSITMEVSPSTSVFALPDTGQTRSYTDTFGEDSDYTINPQSYTKLDSNGNNLPGDAVNWIVVRDNVTGLIWEAKTNDGSINDRDNTYTWQNAQDVFIAELNSQQFGGHSDWRLPSVKELACIVNCGEFLPAINTDYFPDNMSFRYWSSTTCVDETSCAWRVYFNYGSVDGFNKSNSFHVRAVRGGQ